MPGQLPERKMHPALLEWVANLHRRGISHAVIRYPKSGIEGFDLEGSALTAEMGYYIRKGWFKVTFFKDGETDGYWQLDLPTDRTEASTRSHKTYINLLKSLIHYPAHWDTLTYPTFESALREIGCSDCAEHRRMLVQAQPMTEERFNHEYLGVPFDTRDRRGLTYEPRGSSCPCVGKENDCTCPGCSRLSKGNYSSISELTEGQYVWFSSEGNIGNIEKYTYTLHKDEGYLIKLEGSFSDVVYLGGSGENLYNTFSNYRDAYACKMERASSAVRDTIRDLGED